MNQSQPALERKGHLGRCIAQHRSIAFGDDHLARVEVPIVHAQVGARQRQLQALLTLLQRRDGRATLGHVFQAAFKETQPAGRVIYGAESVAHPDGRAVLPPQTDLIHHGRVRLLDPAHLGDALGRVHV